ncbi:unnamed protein product [Closterium sp. NIES-53]
MLLPLATAKTSPFNSSTPTAATPTAATTATPTAATTAATLRRCAHLPSRCRLTVSPSGTLRRCEFALQDSSLLCHAPPHHFDGRSAQSLFRFLLRPLSFGVCFRALGVFAVQYAAHQLNLWPRVSLPETSPTLRWTGEVGDASVFRFYHPTSHRVFPSQDVTFDESVPFYHLFPYRSAPPPPPPLFLAPGPPLVLLEVLCLGVLRLGVRSLEVQSLRVLRLGVLSLGVLRQGLVSLGVMKLRVLSLGVLRRRVRSLEVLNLRVLLCLEVQLVLRRECLRSSCVSGLFGVRAFGVELLELEVLALLELEVLELLLELVLLEVLRPLVLEVLVPGVLELQGMVVFRVLELETLPSLALLALVALELEELELEALEVLELLTLVLEVLELEEQELLTLVALCGRDRTSFPCFISRRYSRPLHCLLLLLTRSSLAVLQSVVSLRLVLSRLFALLVALLVRVLLLSPARTL